MPKRSDSLSHACKIIAAHDLRRLGPKSLLDQLSCLTKSRLVWVLEDDQIQDIPQFTYKPTSSQLLKALSGADPSLRAVCPLLEDPYTGNEKKGNQSRRNAKDVLRPRSLLLEYLDQAAAGRENDGLLLCQSHLRRQLAYWDQSPEKKIAILCWFAALQPPFRQLISPHPLFDNRHYSNQPEIATRKAQQSDRHPIVDYLIGSTRSQRYRAIEPSRLFNPILWQIRQTSKGDLSRRHSQAPLIDYLSAMSTSSTSCPILNQRLEGTLEGIDNQWILRGWCSPIKQGQPVELEAWLGGVLVGTGAASQSRRDLASKGMEDINSGFAIRLNPDDFPLALLDNLNGTRWVITSADHGYTLGRGDWKLGAKDRRLVAQHLVRRAMCTQDWGALSRGLAQTAGSSLAVTLRYTIVEWCAVKAAAGFWDPIPLQISQQTAESAPLLQQGTEAESCCRAELILLAIENLWRHWNSNEIDAGAPAFTITPLHTHCQAESQTLADQLSERIFYGPTSLECEHWQTHLKPLLDALVASRLLHPTPKNSIGTQPLVQALVRICEKVFDDPDLAATLNSLLHSQAGPQDAATLRLQLRKGDVFGVALKLYHLRRARSPVTLQPFDQARALLEISQHSLVTIQAALKRLLPLVPEYQARNPRSSLSRRLLDKLGWHVNTLSTGLIDQMINLGLPMNEGLSVRTSTIELLSQISQALWCGDGGHSGCHALPKTDTSIAIRWLLIGERELPQCWLYRVQQKRQQLERNGAEVRCIDRSELDAWSFSQHIAWADAVLFCRIPATYSSIRALTFARHCGKQVLADVDDLVFTSDFPSPYSTYAGSISHSQYRRLALDSPMQRWSLEQADAVITSTPALAEACHQASEILATKPISVLANLPLPELQSLAKRVPHQNQSPYRAQHLVVSSGTLAHKQIWTDELAPALAQLLESHPDLRLSLIGHLFLPFCLQRFSSRICAIPYSDYSQYLHQLAQGTIALIPLESHATTHCKSAIKWMEASLLGLATVCSPVRAYTDVGQPDEHLLTADDQQAWITQVERLLANHQLRQRLICQARERALSLFNDKIGDQFWSSHLHHGHHNSTPQSERREKALVINVFFAPQSIGGATRVTQDHVRELVDHGGNRRDVTVLCIDHDPWQDCSGDHLPLDLWDWNGARVLRLAVPPRSWADIQDKRVETFCREWFQSESFDIIFCHCCQVLTASPLVVAKELGIPYQISLHDAWWLSPELFLINPSGRLINPGNPFDHLDGNPTAEERSVALERRSILFDLLRNATDRRAVSKQFQAVYDKAGINNVTVRENRSTAMPPIKRRQSLSPTAPVRICHIGGMAMHKGYQILRQAAQILPQDLLLSFTVVDHHLPQDEEPYTSNWNGYPVWFIPPVSMQNMPAFYAGQDVLVAPSIWPESYGLVTREALSAGLWVIASDIGALAEPIIPCENGVKITAGSITELAEALVQCRNVLQSSN
jgi:glycosyltransferase involved in cell wall biosynthesis